jgi:hypothetical protein
VKGKLDSSTQWSEFQEIVASLFRELGFEAQTDTRLVGARTDHDVDVVAHREIAGLKLLWIVECKLWKRRVSKLQVLGLRTIVEDTGASLGIVISDAGFQSGARQAAANTSVRLVTYDEFLDLAEYEIEQMALLQMPSRIAVAWSRYWAISKSDRIGLGWRPDGVSVGYSGQIELGEVQAILLSTLAGVFPPVGMLVRSHEAISIRTRRDAVDVMDRKLHVLEDLLDQGEVVLRAAEVEGGKTSVVG